MLDPTKLHKFDESYEIDVFLTFNILAPIHDLCNSPVGGGEATREDQTAEGITGLMGGSQQGTN
jgi:hypothetical protein